MLGRRSLISLVALGAGLGIVASAQAATVIGQTAPSNDCSNPDDGAQVQLASTGVSYSVPSDGTITSWSAASDTPGTRTKLLILQPVSGTTFNVVAKSDFGIFTSAGVQTFPTQIPVHAGQVIGDWGKLCAIDHAGPSSDHFGIFESSEPPIGASPDFSLSSLPGSWVDLSATVETPATTTPTTPTKHKKCKKKKKHKRSAESAKKKKCKKKKKR
jgi:hypothetical protein